MDGIMTSKLFATRQGTIFLGVIAAVIAAVALIVYLNQYRNSVNNNAAATELTAKSLIYKGTGGGVIASSGLSEVSKVSKLASGAFVNPVSLHGKVALKDIYPGEPLTADDFGPATGALPEQLSQTQRAVTLPLGSPQQVGGQIGAGSHVDIWVTVTAQGTQKPHAVLLVQNAYILGVSGTNVTLRTTTQQAGLLIFASSEYGDSGVWFALRPTVAKNVNPRQVTKG